jgi:hypothetical protein
LPVIIAIIIWLFIFKSTGTDMMLYAMIIISVGIIVFLIMQKLRTGKNPEVKPEIIS